MLFDEVDEVELKDEEEVCVREKDGRRGSYQGVGGRVQLKQQKRQKQATI